MIRWSLLLDGGIRRQRGVIASMRADFLLGQREDRGQAHAQNKVWLAQPAILCLSKYDDLYLPRFPAALGYFREHPECDWLCGDTLMFGEGRKDELISADVRARRRTRFPGLHGGAAGNVLEA